MLQLIRSRVTSIFVKGLFILLIASFAVWGIGDIFLGSPTGKAAIEVGDVEITTAEVLDEFERVRRNMGMQVTAQEAAQIGVLEQVMNDMANRALFVAEARDLGLEIGEEQLKLQIAEMPAFRDQTGKFNPDMFRQALFRAQLSEAEFVRLLREELRRNQVVQAVTAGFAAPNVERDTFYRYRNEQREAKLVTLDAASLPEPPAPSESDIQGYYDSNKEKYRAPEYRSATVLSLTADALAADIEISDVRLREAYESRQDEFRTQGKRTVEQIFLAEKETADKAAAALSEGQTFEAVAKDVADMSPDALSLGSVTRADLEGTALADAVFNAELNVPTAPVQSDLGWHIFKVTEIVPETVKPFDEVKDSLKHDLAHGDALDKIFEIANQIEDSLAAGDTIEEAAKAVEVPVQKIADIDRQGMGKDGAKADGIAGDAGFRSTLFATPLNQQSHLEETRDGGSFILRVDSITEAAVQPLEEVKDKVIADLVAERRADANLKRAQALVQEAASGGLSAAAEKAGIGIVSTEPFTRKGDGLPDGIPADVADIAFDLKVGDIGMSEDLTQIHIAELTAIKEADPASAGEAIDPLARQVKSGMAADAVELLVAALRESHDVKINAGMPLSVINGGDQGGQVPQQSGGLF